MYLILLTKCFARDAARINPPILARKLGEVGELLPALSSSSSSSTLASKVKDTRLPMVGAAAILPTKMSSGAGGRRTERKQQGPRDGGCCHGGRRCGFEVCLGCLLREEPIIRPSAVGPGMHACAHAAAGGQDALHGEWTHCCRCWQHRGCSGVACLPLFFANVFIAKLVDPSSIINIIHAISEGLARKIAACGERWRWIRRYR